MEHICRGDVSGRLAPGFGREQARAELSVLSREFASQSNDKGDGVELGTGLLMQPGQESRQVYAVFGTMFAGVMLVLLLSCADMSNLLLARAAARQREIAVRMSLGAGRPRVVRQLLTESLVLAVLAGGLGIALAWVFPRPVLRGSVGEVSFRLRPDTTVLAFTLGISLRACLACGLAPALAVTGAFANGVFRCAALCWRCRSA